MGKITQGRLNNAFSLFTGHQRWVEKNTGLTVDPRRDLFIQNPDGVLSNNRHFIADTQQEYQPNGDGTTEGQVIHILGYLHAYLATEEPRWLQLAQRAWDAYVQHFYRGLAIPDHPQRWVCNWILNSKQPCLANYPIDPVEPTHGGFKCVPLEFVNGRAKIPSGAPFWGEWLDVVTYAHRGHMTWHAINASVQTIKEDIEGKIDWQAVYDNHLRTDSKEPWRPLAWIDWAGYLGYPSYTVNWGGKDSRAVEHPVSWMVAWTGNKIGVGRGPDDQLWSGEILETGLPQSEWGTVQLEDTSINGVYLFNYAVRLPVDLGGYEFARNECWHNRPVNTPFLGGQYQLGNAADAEVWFIDACYMLWRITGEERYHKALRSVFFTAHEYTYIDSLDRFFRQSVASETPFTDGISYSFSHPELTKIEYGRDAVGFITIHAGESSQHYLEQQSIWYRVNQDSKLVVTYSGEDTANNPIRLRPLLDIQPEKRDDGKAVWYVGAVPDSVPGAAPVEHLIPLKKMCLLNNPRTNEEFIVADYRAVTYYGGCVPTVKFERDIVSLEDPTGAPRDATIVEAFFPDDNAGFIVGFWLQDSKRAPVEQIYYRSDAEFDLRIVDDNNWRWYWVLPDTQGKWSKFTLDRTQMVLSGWQPDHENDPQPISPVFTTVGQITVILENGSDKAKTFAYYCINDVPPLFTADDGWTITFRGVLSGDQEWHARVGDCCIRDFRLDSLNYCPGTIPFSNIYSDGSTQIGGWHGMPYPGYQWPMMYCIQSGDWYQRWLENQIRFLYDSQTEYFRQVKEQGPGCAAYIWNRWDTHKYGPPDTWTTFHWGDGKPWSGYQPRAYMAAARAWYELVMRGKPVPEQLRLYVDRWTEWLAGFCRRSGGHTPNDFPVAPKPPEWVPDDFTGHMCGLWLAGASYASLAGSTAVGLDYVRETAMAELVTEFQVTDIPGHPMNGCWSPDADLSGGNGMAFGFYTGEIFRGMGAYVLYHRYGVGHNMFAHCALPDHTVASLPFIDITGAS